MDDVENGKITVSQHYKKTLPAGGVTISSRQRDGDIQTEQCALYRGQQRQAAEARHAGVCAALSTSCQKWYAKDISKKVKTGSKTKA